MTFFSLLTDPKVLLIIAVLALLIALGVYAWRQSGQMEELKLEHDKMIEQVKHGIVLSESKKSLARLRPDTVSNMSEETATQIAQDADADVESEGACDADAECEVGWEDEEHNAYIKEIIRINDSKRAKDDDYYVAEQQQSGHNGPVYDSGEEEIVFDNYADSTDESAQAEILAHVEKELNLAREMAVTSTPQVQQIVTSPPVESKQKPKPLNSVSKRSKKQSAPVAPIAPVASAAPVAPTQTAPAPTETAPALPALPAGKIKVVIGKKAT